MSAPPIHCLEDAPSPPGLPPQALPMLHKCSCFWFGGLLGKRWLRATVVGGREVAPTTVYADGTKERRREILYHVTFDGFGTAGGPRDAWRGDVPLAELRLDAVRDPTPPYAADGVLHDVYIASGTRSTVFTGPDTFRGRRPLRISTYAATPRVTIKDGNHLGELTGDAGKNAIALPYGRGDEEPLEWIRRMHAHLQPTLFRVDKTTYTFIRQRDNKPCTSASYDLRQVFAPSPFMNIEGDVKYDWEHTAALRNRFAEVCYYGHCPSDANRALTGWGIISPHWAPVITSRPEFRPIPYHS